MESEAQNKKIECALKKIKELEESLRNTNQVKIVYSTDQVKLLYELGYIKKELYAYHCNKIETLELYRKCPDLLTSELTKCSKGVELSKEDSLKLYEDVIKNDELTQIILENKELISQEIIDDLPGKFFKSLQDGEFGIARLAADPLNRVPELLKNTEDPVLVHEDIYLFKLEITRRGDKIRLEYRFRASDQEAANLHAENYVKRLRGRQKKVFEACWAMANQKMRRSYSCNLTDLMLIAYPSRKGGTYFSTKEKVEFYQDLLDLSQTQFIVSKSHRKKSTNSKKTFESFLLPFITIHKIIVSDGSRECDKYPNQISLSVLFNPLYEGEKMYNVGAAIKYTTLELHADDLQLAEWLQIRKNQLMGKTHIELTRDFLIELAGYKSDSKNLSDVNKKLLEKLERLKKVGILKGCPHHIREKVVLKIR